MSDACILCADPGFRMVERYDAPDVYECAAGVSTVGYWREWVACNSCGFHYSRYSRPGDIFDAFYEEGYRGDEAEWRGEGAFERFNRIMALPLPQSETHQRIAWIKQQISDVRHWCNDDCAMLDIGGASGVFAALFQDDVWRSRVVDPAVEGQFIQAELGIPYISKPLEDAEFSEKFHLVAMNYVLEHVKDPMATLRKARSLLKLDGMLFVEVPDAANFDRLPGTHDIFNACHLWMFDRNSLGRMLEQVGFRMLKDETLKVLRGHTGLMVLAEPIE